MYLLGCGPERDGAGEFLPAPALIAEAPDRRLVKCGGMREFTDKIFHRSRERTDALRHFFFQCLNRQLLRPRHHGGDIQCGRPRPSGASTLNRAVRHGVFHK
jgi:hypothetical protein